VFDWYLIIVVLQQKIKIKKISSIFYYVIAIGESHPSSTLDSTSIGILPMTPMTTIEYDRMGIVITARAVYRAGKSMAVFLHSP
jgi:hypothetical protein